MTGYVPNELLGRLVGCRMYSVEFVLNKLTPGIVLATAEATGIGLRIELSSGTIVIYPAADEAYQEIALLSGFDDRRWMCWRPGEDSFEDLA